MVYGDEGGLIAVCVCVCVCVCVFVCLCACVQLPASNQLIEDTLPYLPECKLHF